jgi:hypothetical protein
MAVDFEKAGVSSLSFDIDHQGAYLYIAAKDGSGDLQVLKQDAALANDAEIVHSPSGTALNVQCGRNSDRIWLAGDMGIIKYDGIAAQYWQSDAFTTTWTVETFHIGPDDDELVLVFIDTGAIWETYFLQNYFDTEWFELNENRGFQVFCADRLDTSIDEFLIGCNYFYLSSVNYSPNAGFDFQDVSGALGDVGVQATSVIFL